MKDNKSLRLEVHHAKTFDDICIGNSISTVEQALTCKKAVGFRQWCFYML
jgi:hypothetical protein